MLPIIIKKAIKRLLKNKIINTGLLISCRAILSASWMPFGIRQKAEGFLWAISVDHINKFKVVLGRYKNFIIAGDIHIPEIRDLYWWGKDAFEPETYSIFIKLVKSCSLFIDVGANIGYYSLVAAATNKKTKIVSFEPVPLVFSMLKNNIVLNNLSIHAENMAVSNVNGPVTLYIPKDSNVSASENPEFRPDTSKLIVNAVTLDDYCSKNGLGFPDLVKLDTETTEPKIIEGMKKIIMHSETGHNL